ncbi:MAG: hypothetical protein H6672_01030 [Anaerolineaceae bacterium]|nr:hypothetical protein [Anaerolineaceae bacterium]
MAVVLHILTFIAGLLLVGYVLVSAVRSFVLPRGDNVWLTRVTFLAVLRLFWLRTRKAQTYEERDRIMALFAPLALLVLPVVWLVGVLAGYTLMFWAVGVDDFYAAFSTSGSSLLTLGFTPVNTLGTTVLAFSEATIGLGLVALLIAYLPTMYTAFSRREALVTLLEVRAGSPPSAVTLIVRAHRIRELRYLTELWVQWELWFAEIDESHTSLAPVNFFRSPAPDRSWVTAAGAVLDAAALMCSAVDVPRTPEPQLCLRAGYLALRHIADFFELSYNPQPLPTDPISIFREEFDVACAELAESGVPVVADLNQAWLDYAGWRVNYDAVLLQLAELMMAPYAPWSSDRGVIRKSP